MVMRFGCTPIWANVLQEIGLLIRTITCSLDNASCGSQTVTPLVSSYPIMTATIPAVLRLQMSLMCWNIDIVHWNNIHLTNANYWSLLGADICFDPLFKSYLDFDRGLREQFPAPTSLPMKPKNMPYYRGPCVTTTADSSNSGVPSTAPTADVAHQSHCQFNMDEMIHHNCHGLSHLSNVRVRSGNFDKVTPMTSHASSNHEIPTYAHQILNFNWAVYSFGGGHFVLTVLSRNLPFQITLACDQYECGCALFCKFTSCPDIFGSGNDLLHHIWASVTPHRFMAT